MVPSSHRFVAFAIRSVVGGLFVLLLVAQLGCSGGTGAPSDLGKVTGVVTLDKKPLPGAYVEFIPGTARKSTGVTDANGVYKLQYDHETSGAVLGSHRVTINTGAHLADMPETAKPESIPVKYNEKSTLTAEVKQGENKIDFDLTSD